MGRKRRSDRHLPARMYLEHGAYYFRAHGQPRKNLGRDLATALTVYGSIIGANWSGRTVGDAIDRYRLEILPAKRSPDTRRDQGKQLDRLKIGFGHLLPDNVSAQGCYKYADARRSKDGKRVPIAARHEVSLLGHVFAKMIKWGMTTHNPVRGIELDRSPKQRQVTMAEVEALKALANPRMAAAIDLAVNIGQRRGDLLTLKHSDIDDEWLHVEQSKGGAKVDLQKSHTMMSIIATLKAFKPDIPNEYLIRKGNGKPYTVDGFSSNWQRLMRKHVAAGGQRFSFHRLRSVSADTGTIEEARDRLGHASEATTRRFYRNTAVKAKPRE